MARKSPLAIVKEKFGDKDKLVEAVKVFMTDDLWVKRTAEDRGKDSGIEYVSKAKLLKPHATFTAVKEKFGTRAKLIDAIAEIEKRTKDEGFKKRLSAFPVPRLFDMYQSAQKRTAPKTAKPAKVAKVAKPKPVAKKALKPAAKKAAAKKKK